MSKEKRPGGREWYITQITSIIEKGQPTNQLTLGRLLKVLPLLLNIFYQIWIKNTTINFAFIKKN